MDIVAIGKNIKVERKRQGLSLEELGNKSNLSFQKIWHHEGGKKKKFVEHELVRIAAALGVTLDRLCGIVKRKPIRIALPDGYRYRATMRATLTDHYMIISQI